MNKKTAISLIMALLMVVSTFVVGTAEVTASDDDTYNINVVKEVYNDGLFVDNIHADIGDTLTFRITLFYEPTHENSSKATNISVVETLPPCLEYADSTAINYGPDLEFYGESCIIDNKIYWNLTDDHGIELFPYDECQQDPERNHSVKIHFNATVVNYTELEGEENHALATATECYSENCVCLERDLLGEGTALIVVERPNPQLSIEKKVYDEETQGWAEETIAYLGETVTFELNITNTGNVPLCDISVKDVLPEFLSFLDSSIPPTEVCGTLIEWTISLDVEEYCLIGVMAKVEDKGEGLNVANATYDEVVAEDDAKVIARRHIEIKKFVEDPETGLWVEELDHVIKGTHLNFRIFLHYYGENRMPCLLLGDMLPSCCLEYVETTKVLVNGEEVTCDSYPEISILEEEEVIETCCNQDIVLPECLLLWDFRNAVGFELNDEGSVMIDFTANVSNYCYDQVYNMVGAHLWSCYHCDIYEEYDELEINCCPPPTTFEKTVYDEKLGEYVEKIDTIVNDIVEFNLEFTYHGEDLTNADIIIRDELPCNLEYYSSSGADNVSEDLKIVTWNIEDINLSDGDSLSAYLSAIVTDVSGCCGECMNTATICVYKECGEKILQLSDTAQVNSTENDEPYPPILTGDEEGEVGDELSFVVTSTDPNDDDIWYLVEYGDGTDSGWIGPYASGTSGYLLHEYDAIGEYIVKATAKDTYGEQSLYGNQLTVEIKKGDEPPIPEDPNATIAVKMLGIGQIKATIENNGGVNLTNIKWNITAAGGLLNKINVTNNGTLEKLNKGEHLNVITGGNFVILGASFGKGSIFGLGKISGSVTFTSDEFTTDNYFTGFVIGKLVLITSQS